MDLPDHGLVNGIFPTQRSERIARRMGALIDKLERAAAGTTQPLGFAAIGNREKISPLLMIGRIDAEMESEAKKIASLQLDAAIININESTKSPTLNRSIKAIGDTVWGTSTVMIGPSGPKGSDFQVFSSDETPIAFLGGEDRTTIMQIETDLDDSVLRTVEDLPVDGFFLSLAIEQVLTLKQLITIARVRSVTSKWIMLHMTHLPTNEDLAQLRDAGINALVIDVEKHTVASIKKARADMLDLPRQSGDKRRDRSSPTLPSHQISRETSHTHEEEDDFDEDTD